MIEDIRYVRNKADIRDNTRAETFGKRKAESVREFHRSFPTYHPTELYNLKELSNIIGVGKLFIKDESTRFGLNAFKSLGASYCIGRILLEKADVSEDELKFDRLLQDDIQGLIGDMTLVTATDGNHGRGVAWAADQLGIPAVVFMPKGSATERLQNIQKLGARAEITDLNYDDTVRFAAACAKNNGWTLVQDTAWDGYEKIPTWIMQGYTTLALEVTEQLGEEIPTHIILQAGVGSMAGALAAFFADHYRDKKPIIIIVEPDKADCIYRTAEVNDGTLQIVKGSLNTIMAGLACGEPCAIGWALLKRFADFFISMPDYVAAKGMRILGNPIGDDVRIITGESGAAGLGFVAEVMMKEKYDDIRREVSLGRDAKVLCISTEGATDEENYRRIVWDGIYSEE